VSQKRYDWETAIRCQDLVERVVDRHFRQVPQHVNLDRDDLISRGLEEAARAAINAPKTGWDGPPKISREQAVMAYLYTAVRQGLWERLYGQLARTRKVEYVSDVDPNGRRNHEDVNGLLDIVGADEDQGYIRIDDTDLGAQLLKLAYEVIDGSRHSEIVRERFRLRFEEGWKYEDIAEWQGVSHASVHQSISRVLEKVRQRIGLPSELHPASEEDETERGAA
jgi:DNA-directed RNA polymerase specialized sigma24 family protein